MVAPTKSKNKSAVDMGNNIVALNFDSEVLVKNQAPVLKLAVRKPAACSVRYKNTAICCQKEDIGQKLQEIVDGVIEHA